MAGRAHGPLPHCGVTDGAQPWVLKTSYLLLAQSVTPEGAAGGLAARVAASPWAPIPLYLHDLGVVRHAFFLSIGLHSEF